MIFLYETGTHTPLILDLEGQRPVNICGLLVIQLGITDKIHTVR